MAHRHEVIVVGAGGAGLTAALYAANEAAEQRLLQLEVAELEAVWRKEEEIAAIVDGELTPLPI